MAACSGKRVSEQELKSYILNDENGLHKNRKINDIDIDVFYRPAELVWIKDLEEISDPVKREAQQEAIDTLSYFMFHFSRNGKEIENAYVSNSSEFTSVINYLSFDIANDIHIISGSDTTDALDVMYARTFGGMGSTGVMAIFNKDVRKNNKNIKVYFDDSVFGTGNSEFDFLIDDIKKTPTLTINKL
ncbi:MAG TPA: hypothetical protein VIM65_12835 [Cyclobacteriaceae bacterium]